MKRNLAKSTKSNHSKYFTYNTNMPAPSVEGGHEALDEMKNKQHETNVENELRTIGSTYIHKRGKSNLRNVQDQTKSSVGNLLNLRENREDEVAQEQPS